MTKELTPESLGRSRAGTTFPYYDLEQACDLARHLHDRLGGTATADQIAAACNQTPRSGAFRLRLSAALHFGFLERERDRVRLGQIGLRWLQPSSSSRALVEAFLSVALYRRIYEDHKGRLLPPPQGLESYMKNAGVVVGQADRARQVFQRSAEQAGLFQFGADRLVLPPEVSTEQENSSAVPSDDPLPATESRTLQSASSSASLHPALAGMLQELPPSGRTWDEDEFNAWSSAFLGVLRVVHRPSKQPKRDPE